MATILITGGTGCIGSATVYQLLKSREVKHIAIASRSNNTDSLKLWLGDNLDPRLSFQELDISDYQSITSTVYRLDPTHIVHLGAYQSPDCSMYHAEGMEINIGGTMALFDVAEKLPHLKRFVFASSAAVYGMRSMYPKPGITEDAPLAPPNHYGIWKLAGEHLARLFHETTNVPTVCLRLNATYGKGRDRGLTSAPTNALKAIAMGAFQGHPIPFQMLYEGRENYHYVEDVGAHFASCTLQPFEGYGAFNIKGQTIEVADFLAIATRQAETMGIGEFADLSISDRADPNLFVSDLSHDKITREFKNLPLTSIEDGVKKSLLDFYDMAERGILEYPVKL